ncbi:hypothetical protein HOLleu_15214 [Holothuria leucospilota]|uniref:Endonuclease/exonuclease/phosphatase domain-containing protein n=1 Tax=Holothuria leucospilota TaxID=206669 RepID=A0A9Q1H9H0_HOLLE|nr:hypothetical protein HOLleu_15214 [Holothuria leucospilota]
MYYHESCSVSLNSDTPKGACKPYCSERSLPFSYSSSFRDFYEADSVVPGNDLDSITDANNIGCITESRYLSIEQFNDFSSNGFNIFHLNSRSLIRNFDNIQDYLLLLNHNFIALGFTETWLKENTSPLIHLEGYCFVENHRQVKRGGGVCLFIRNDFVLEVRHDLSFLNNDVESIFIEISVPNVTKRVVIGVIYRPPTGSLANFYNHLCNILSDISSHSKYGFVMGDFNVDLCKHLSRVFKQYCVLRFQSMC